MPAKRIKQTLTLEDSTKVEATLVGDEYGHWYVDSDGRKLRLSDNGIAYYLTESQVDEITTSRSKRLQIANEARSASLAKAKTNLSSSSSTTSAFTGSKKGLVILVNFADKKFSTSGTQSEFNNMFNKVGYSNNNHVGSVHDYFSDNSYNQFNLTFDVVGPVTVSQKESYYGASSSTGNDSYPATMVIEACKLADKSVNFKNYDWDGDGYVDQVYVIYAGYGENCGAPSTTIWPHEWNLYSASYYGDGSGVLTLDGVKINTYACSNELAGTSGTRLSGIGTACHEFAHCLTFPDIYDTDYSGGESMGHWDLMDSGSYNGQTGYGERPAALTAFEKWMIGWIEPTELSSSCYVSGMPALADDKDACYVIHNTNKIYEFYLLENRQNGKWDFYQSGSYLGHGLFVTHVDYDATAWGNNKVNDVPSHQRMIFFPADNNFTESAEGYAGDTYPGTRNNTSLTDTSSPAATVYNGSKMGKPITEITEKSGLISFSFMGGKSSGDDSGGDSGSTEPSSVSIPYSVTVNVGESSQLKPTLTPTSASTTYTWYTNDESIATVNVNGYVRGVSEGSTTVYCQTANGLKSNNCAVTISALAANSISIIPSYLYLPVGETHQMEYSLSPWNAVTSLTWSVKGYESIVSITDDGELTALSPGTAFVSITTGNGKTDICEVCVPPVLQSLSLPEKMEIGAGQSTKLTLTVVPADANYEGTWSSSNDSIVTVNTTGSITAHAVGEATVKFSTTTGISSSTKVSVYKPSYYFLILLRNGNHFTYEIKSEPIMTQTDGKLIFTTKTDTQEFEESAVRKMIIVDYDAMSRIGDINGDSQIDIADVAALIQMWIDKKEAGIDLNFDGVTDLRDLDTLKEIIFNQTE